LNSSADRPFFSPLQRLSTSKGTLVSLSPRKCLKTT